MPLASLVKGTSILSGSWVKKSEHLSNIFDHVFKHSVSFIMSSQDLKLRSEGVYEGISTELPELILGFPSVCHSTLYRASCRIPLLLGLRIGC